MQVGLKSPVMIERIHHKLNNKLGSDEECKTWANEAIQYLCEINCFTCPYLNLFLSTSGQTMRSLKSGPQVRKEHNFYGNTFLIEVVSHNYKNAIELLELYNNRDLGRVVTLHKLCQVLLISKDFKSLQELDYRVSFFKNKVDSLTVEERRLLFDVILIICASYFLQNRFLECSSEFFTLLEENPDDVMNSILAMTDNEESELLTRSEFLSIVTISTLIALPMDYYEDFMSLDTLVSFFDLNNQLSTCLNLLIATSFQKFFDLWHGEINEFCVSSPFLSTSWKSAIVLMRCKIYSFYLSVCDKIQITYLAQRIGIDYTTVKNEIVELIEKENLSLEMKQDLVFHKHKHYLEQSTKTLQETSSTIEKNLTVGSDALENKKNIFQEFIASSNNG